ncbi:uncharacterized protein LOC101863442 [Aplysia californica]|uniref:Uncharacterized protein LOC101863442 n=1 Tax=Aplysia californica TaxID=6500 RepID=A0ABM1VUT4_APLCA|nr:uncharacterized protein LOC101863442 [Aplysia californica]
MSSPTLPKRQKTEKDNDNDAEKTMTVVNTPTPSAAAASSTGGHGDSSENSDSFCFSDSANLEDVRKLLLKLFKDRNWDQFHTPRNVLLDLVAEVGELAEIFQWKGEVKEGIPEMTEGERKHVGEELSDVLLCLIDLSHRCRIDLTKAVLDKISSIAKKYPKDKAYGRTNKYTDYQLFSYSDQAHKEYIVIMSNPTSPKRLKTETENRNTNDVEKTGVGVKADIVDNIDNTLSASAAADGGGETESSGSFRFSDSTSLEDLRKLSMEFIKERNWDQFHSPRNVLLALVGEVGELAEIFQWKGEVSEGLPELTEGEREHVGQELSDVLLYLLDLSQRCHIDLPKAVLKKMAANAKKYPKDRAYGRANKYTDYQ